MCGIAGVFCYRGTDQEVAPRALGAMTDALAHRGPDGRGIWLSPDRRTGLGHRRLSIIDLSDAGAQPMCSPDGRFAVTYNGEIYNFREIRAELEERGRCFRSRTDTEVLLHGYAAWGEGLLERLNGMFAFGLWDEAAGRLWLVRDRIGIKPLFYLDDGATIFFASEIKGILAHPDVPRRPDLEALNQFLALNYTPAPATGFAGIRQLLPGEFLEVRRRETPRREKYWDIPFPEEPMRIGPEEAAEELELRLREAVRLRLVSDVPLGAFLSGGVDSSAVVRAMAQESPGAVRTFSIGFGEASYDESGHAREVADALGVSNHGEQLPASAGELLPSLVLHHEEPTADSSSAAVCRLSAMTRRHVTVALSGDGADELLAGYETYRASRMAESYRRLPRWLRRGVVEPLGRALPVSHRKYSFESKVKRFLYGASQGAHPPHCCWRVICTPEMAERLCTPDFRRAAPPASALSGYAAAMLGPPAKLGPVASMLAGDARFYLPNDMLVKVDRMSMAFGLEVRVPFLDHHLVSFCFALPESAKVGRGGETKSVLKRSLRMSLPARLIDRPKAGFVLPLGRWMQGEFGGLIDMHLSPKALSRMDLLQPAEVARLVEEHRAGRFDHGLLLYGLLVLSLWWQIWIERSLQVESLKNVAGQGMVGPR